MSLENDISTSGADWDSYGSFANALFLTHWLKLAQSLLLKPFLYWHIERILTPLNVFKQSKILHDRWPYMESNNLSDSNVLRWSYNVQHLHDHGRVMLRPQPRILFTNRTMSLSLKSTESNRKRLRLLCYIPLVTSESPQRHFRFSIFLVLRKFSLNLIH